MLVKSLKELLSVIECEVAVHEGSGFTWEVSPIITTDRVYRAHEKWFGKAGLEWKENRGEKCPSYFAINHNTVLPAYATTNHTVDLETTGIDWKQALPAGISVQMTPPLVLRDDTVLRKPNGYQDRAYYLAGKRVYLTVTDEYAARVFREVYTDIGLPFRDLLLAKHHQILKKIALSFNLLLSHRKEDLELRVRFEGVCVGSKYFEFKDFGMQPLDTRGQLYGMLLAIIETLNNEYPEWSTPVFNQYYMSDYDGVALSVTPKAKIPPELQQW